MNRAKLPFVEYINWLFKQYQELKKAQNGEAVYRLVDSEEKNGQYTLVIQVVGKSVTFTATPEEILRDDTLVEYFSSKDIRTITYYATKSLQQPKQKIVIQRFSEKLNQIIFGVKHVNEEKICEKTAAEISLDKNLLNSLSPEEAHRVGYSAAHEKFYQDGYLLKEVRHEKLRN